MIFYMEWFILVDKVIKRFKNYLSYFILILKLIFKRISRKKHIWFIATTIYGNLGDYAIIYSQYKYLI